MKQLTLPDRPTIEPRLPRPDDWHRAISVTVRDCKDPALRGHKALEVFSEPYRPQWVICHREDAAAIGAEIDGILVIATGKARGLFLLGPLV